MTADIEHPVVATFQPSDRNIKIWRYMDLTKLVAFLETGSLYFARADTFGDPYEGSWTRLNKAAEEQQGFSKQREETGGYKPRGITVDIDFDKVVETIRVQPTTPAWARFDNVK